jgi:signal transduction histidine kinase/AraC-like DNA-binding protein
VLIVWFLLFCTASVQAGETGIQNETVLKSTSYYQKTFTKHLRNYSRSDCGGLWINRAIIQDKRGVIYAGGDGGLREFDGVTWRTIAIPNDWVSAMDIDESGTIYIGGNNEIGYLAPNSGGTLKYRSMVDLLEENQRNFSILAVHALPEGIYFNAGAFLLLWEPETGKTRTWKSETGFDLSFACEGELYIYELDRGLKEFDSAGETLRNSPGYESIAGEIVCMLVPFAPGKKLVATKERKLYIHDGTTCKSFVTGADDYLNKNYIIRGIRLASGDFAVSTFFGGVVVIDAGGKVKNVFNRASGLPDGIVNFIFEDCHGNLWLALEPAISKIEQRSPISMHFDPPKIIQSVVEHRGNFYVAAHSGLYRLSPDGIFRIHRGISWNCRQLLSIDGSLLVASLRGVFEVSETGTRRIVDSNALMLVHSEYDGNRVWGQSFFNFFSLYKKNGHWVEEHRFQKEEQILSTIMESADGSLWMGAVDQHSPVSAKSVLRIVFSNLEPFSRSRVDRYVVSSGLPSDVKHIFRVLGHAVFSTRDGIFRFDNKINSFVPELSFGDELMALSKKKSIKNIVRLKEGNVCVLFSDGSLAKVVRRGNGEFTIDERLFGRLPPHAEIRKICASPDGDICWLIGPKAFIRFDLKVLKRYNREYPTLLRRMTANGKLIFDGFEGEGETGLLSGKPIRIPYNNRNLRFEFAAPFFDGESDIRYRYILEGNDRKWSDWTADADIEYSTLEPGNYRFRVKARNVYRHLGREAEVRFSILHPWYLRWWAFGVYLLVLSMMTYLVFKWRSAMRLEKEKIRLENTVRERTKEIKRKNIQLEEQTFRLKDQSEKLKEMDQVKSRFFANISHEFRTPLALIMGPLEKMLADESARNTSGKEEFNTGGGRKKKLKLMLRNSQRLLRLIDRLLELSRLESGKVELNPHRQNIVSFIKGIAAAFEPAASKNELDLTFQSEKEKIELYFDPEKMEEIIFNLLSNALKFTPAGGKVVVKVTVDPEKNDDFQQGAAIVSVRDTGPGIPCDQMVHVFKRFYQSGVTYEHHKKGSGIGLAIAKELIELHRGKVEIWSREGQGTEFIVRIPLGDEHDETGNTGAAGETDYRSGIDMEGKVRDYFENSFSPDSMNGEESCVPSAEDEPGETGDSVPAPAAQESPGNGKPGTDIILIVEDSADFREYMRGALAPHYTVVTAGDGGEGIRKALDLIPDLIISDIMMPEIDGYQLCRQLKSNRKTSHIPIILLTARASENSVVQGLETGADDYITKPFNSKILCARIDNLIEIRRRLQLKRRGIVTVGPPELDVSSMDEEFFKELVEIIDKNVSDPEFNVELLKNMLCIGRTTLYRKVTALTGLSPNKFIRSYRLKRAAKLLEANYGNVSKVAMEVGFTNMAYFSQCFKEEFNQSPSAYLSSLGNSRT